MEEGSNPVRRRVLWWPKAQPELTQSVRGHLTATVTLDHADILLLSCCFISGMVDSTMYHAYGTFVSMQTGNTLFLGLGGARPHNTTHPYGWAKSLVSISCFCLGCSLFSYASHLVGPLRRVTLALSFLAQALIIVLAAALIEANVVNGDLASIKDDIDWKSMLPIALLSFQSAGQIVASRTLSLSEIPTFMLTVILHDLSTDSKVLKPPRQNVKRNRRLLAFLGILLGSIVSSFTSAATGKVQDPLWIAGGIKAVITLAWMAWPVKKIRT